MSTLLDTTPVTRSRLKLWMARGILLAAVVFLVSCVVYLERGSVAFGTYWASGTAAAQGMNPFAMYPRTVITQVSLNGHIQEVNDVNLNPPCLLPFLQAMSHLSYSQFGVTWTIGSVFLLVLSIGLLLRNNPKMPMFQLLWLALATPVFDTIAGGQIYFLLMLLSTLVWILHQKRELGAAIALGLLVAIKPTTAFWPVFLFLSGRKKLALQSVAVTAAVSLAPLALYPPKIYGEWFAALKADNHWILPTNIAIPAFFTRLGHRGAGLAVALAVFMLLAYWIARTKPSMEITSGIALCATLLCAPMAWYDYTLILAPVFVAHRWARLELIAAFLMASPYPLASLIFFPIGALVGLNPAGLCYFAAAWMMLISYLRRSG